jgi:hypothetical protein
MLRPNPLPLPVTNQTLDDVFIEFSFPCCDLLLIALLGLRHFSVTAWALTCTRNMFHDFKPFSSHLVLSRNCAIRNGVGPEIGLPSYVRPVDGPPASFTLRDLNLLELVFIPPLNLR